MLFMYYMSAQGVDIILPIHSSIYTQFKQLTNQQRLVCCQDVLPFLSSLPLYIGEGTLHTPPPPPTPTKKKKKKKDKKREDIASFPPCVSDRFVIAEAPKDSLAASAPNSPNGPLSLVACNSFNIAVNVAARKGKRVSLWNEINLISLRESSWKRYCFCCCCFLVFTRHRF